MFNKTYITRRYLAVLFSGTFLIIVHVYWYTGGTILQTSTHHSQQETEFSSINGTKTNLHPPNLSHIYFPPSNVVDIEEGNNRLAPKTTVWISMGLCFEKNTHMYGKKNYPFTKVTPLSIMLWNYFLPWVKVILYIVYDKTVNEEHRILYDSQLKQNVDVNMVQVRWVETGDMKCPTKSQLIRMWAFQEEIIHSDDIIVNVDANLFVMTPKILNPIYQTPNRDIWIFQWDRAAFKKDGFFGETFNQNLIATTAKGKFLSTNAILQIRAIIYTFILGGNLFYSFIFCYFYFNVSVWRKIVEPLDDELCNQSWLRARLSDFGLEKTPYKNDSTAEWGYDQDITTYGILKHKLCTVSKNSGLWNIPGLSEKGIYFPEMDDSKICWHGMHYEDCNFERTNVPNGCKWWHFYPHHNLAVHLRKFRELTNNSFNLKISDLYFNLRSLKT